VFDETGSVNRAAKAAGVAFSVARRILVVDGLVSAAALVCGKPEARQD
jgi:IS30 family transposase